MSSPVTLRPIQPSDTPFLRKVYASTRIAELEPLGWTAQQQEIFLRQQFDAQHYHYQNFYTNARFQVIMQNDTPVGRLYLARWPHELRLIDITLLPEYRGQGIGSALMQDILNEGMHYARPVRIHVEKFNPALRWYQRFGFTELEDRGIYWFLEWMPAVAMGQAFAHA